MIVAVIDIGCCENEECKVDMFTFGFVLEFMTWCLDKHLYTTFYFLYLMSLLYIKYVCICMGLHNFLFFSTSCSFKVYWIDYIEMAYLNILPHSSKYANTRFECFSTLNATQYYTYILKINFSQLINSYAESIKNSGSWFIFLIISNYFDYLPKVLSRKVKNKYYFYLLYFRSLYCKFYVMFQL